MRRDVLDLRAFYATPLGAAVRGLVARKIAEAWSDARGLDVLGLGYATPYLPAFVGPARRAVAAMPGAQGVEAWPAGAANLACLAEEAALPFPNALFDRVLVIHGLEESDDPAAYLEEVKRVMAPAGRVILAVASRRGLWAGSEATPFGYGRPFTRTQLEDAVRGAGLEPAAWSRALYVPPLPMLARWAEAFEQAGSRLAPPVSGLILLEAVKQTFAVKPAGARSPAFAPGRLRPQPIGVAGRVTRRV
ncbi:MAG TPA: methyltransferase domain-containing protein [Caulobacteraceae bacterium]|jgi:SAM-dependent methyltransferase|nr:methyltransferase domain-containing protein [Caulobacteraceae bacterium]